MSAVQHHITAIPSPLRRRLLLQLAMILTCGLLLSSGYLWFSASQDARTQTIDAGDKLMRQSAVLLQPLLLADDRVSLNYLLNELGDQPEVRGIALYNQTNELVARSGETEGPLERELILEREQQSLGRMLFWLDPAPAQEFVNSAERRGGYVYGMMSIIPPMLARSLTAAFLLFATSVPLAQAQDTAPPSVAPPGPTTRPLSEVEQEVRKILTVGTLERNAVMAKLVDRGNTDVVPALVQSLRFMRQDPWTITNALQVLTGEQIGTSWHDWVLWQEAHPEITPFEGFAEYKAWVYSQIDPNFRLFLYDGIEHTIRLEEIVWGGVRKDGIPALVNPKLIAPQEATYLIPEEMVFGVKINGDVRAYPLRMMDWHEMFNDVIGGVPVALAYCTLCGSGILYETTVDGRDQPFEFGSSGFLYRSNKLMYDRQTNSLWNQFTGAPVVGELTNSGIVLKTRPVAITTWQDWFAKHPDTKVLSLDTGYSRDYSPGRPYFEYFASPDTMFPALLHDTRLPTKSYVFALRGEPSEKAWALSLFHGGAVINDTAGGEPVVLIGDTATRTVRAYASEGRQFIATEGNPHLVRADGQDWQVTEDALVPNDGEPLPRLAGHIAYWFAWQNFKPQAEVRVE